MISDDDKERVRAATDIVQLVGETVVLKPRGADFWGCCPFHQEKSPSFHVNPTTGLWHCFGCHQGGDVFDYVMKRENLEFLDAVRYLAERAHIELDEGRAAARGPRRTLFVDALEAAQEPYLLRLMRGKGPGPDQARRYLAGRGFDGRVCRRWHLGFADGSAPIVRELSARGFTRAELIAADLASDRGGRLRDRFFNRVMFPIHDEQGRCIGFGGRVMGDSKPKYLNSKETSVFHKSKHMYAFDYAKDAIAAKGYAIVTEGYTDVISMHEAGFENTVASLGTALSEDHVRTLSRFAKTIVCMFDGDAAGQHAAEAAVRYMERTKASMRCVVLPDNQDPAEFLAAHGADAMRGQLKGARPLIDFVLDKRLEGLDLSSPGLRLAALDELAKLLAPLRSSYLLDGYASQVSSRLGIDAGAVKEKIRSAEPEREARTTSDDALWRPDYDVPLEPAPERRDVPAPRVSLAELTAEDRTQLRAERNLLSMLAESPDAFRPYADRIATFSWADARYEAIAWAILATPANTSPADAVRAATRACADAPRILSGGGFAATSSWDEAKNVEFVVGEAEIRSIDRRVAQINAQLASGHDPQAAREALAQLQELRRRRAELRGAQPRE